MYAVCFALAWMVAHILYRFRVVGREKLPDGGYVMLCNHRSAMDIIFLALARGRVNEPLIFAKAELFKVSPLVSWFLRRLGAVPISRGKGDTAALDRAIAQVRDGRDLLVFPEGTRTKDGHMGQLKSGAFVVAAKAGVPVVPCRILYEKGKPRLFSRVTLAIGDAMSLEELGLACENWQTPTPAALRCAKRLCVQRLKALYAENAQATGCPLPTAEPAGSPESQPAEAPAETVG